MNIREYIKENRLLTDGAMGTYFETMEVEDILCSEEANIIYPEIVEKIHQNYVDQGAQLIRCNTFMANKETLQKIRQKNRAFQYISLKDFVKAGYAIAKEVEVKNRQSGKTIFAAADIGPLREIPDKDHSEILDEYYEICDAFLEEGCQVYVLETFPDEKDLLQVASYIREKKPNAWILGQFTFMPTGYGSTGSHYSIVLKNALKSEKLDAVGLNCGIGASHMGSLYKKFIHENIIPKGVSLSALPNCGYPQIVRGKAIYSDSIPYFSTMLKEIADLGVSILGGCCGTNPEYIGAISKWVWKEKLAIPVKITAVTKPKEEKVKLSSPNAFYEKLQQGKTIYAVELDPPFDTDCSKLIHGAKELTNTKTDIITIADSPLGRSRADSLLMASKIKKEVGIQVMPHLCNRDRNRIAIRGGILGAYINDIRNFLLVTGDPVARSDRDNTKGVFDFNSIKCMSYVKQMNESLFADDPIIYGGALNQDGVNVDAIAGRMMKKMEEGCSFFLTQPVYSQEGIERLHILKEKTGAKLLVGILPLVSYRNAIFMKHEMPGIHVPDEIVDLYKEDAGREEWEKVAIHISMEIMNKCENIGAGYYLMTPFNRVGIIKNILEQR